MAFEAFCQGMVLEDQALSEDKHLLTRPGCPGRMPVVMRIYPESMSGQETGEGCCRAYSAQSMSSLTSAWGFMAKIFAAFML